MQRASRYDVAAMQRDMENKGWLPVDLARAAEVSHMAVSRFFAGKHQTARIAKKLAVALGHEDASVYRVEEAMAS